jgi:glutaredoxin 3
MANPRRIEVFTAGCPLCPITLELVKRAVSRCGCEVIERRCTEAAGFDLAKKYGIKTMPTIVVDGRIAFEGKITQAQANLLRR